MPALFRTIVSQTRSRRARVSQAASPKSRKTHLIPKFTARDWHLRTPIPHPFVCLEKRGMDKKNDNTCLRGMSKDNELNHTGFPVRRFLSWKTYRCPLVFASHHRC